MQGFCERCNTENCQCEEDYENDISLTDDERAFISNVREQPYISVRERRYALGWEDERYSRVTDNLAERGIVEKVAVAKGRGRPIILYQIAGKVPGVKHEFYIDWLIGLISKRVECMASRIGPDIQIPSIGVAINVELGSSDIRGNIETALEEFNPVIICSDDEKVLEAVRSQIKIEERKSVFVCFVWDVPDLFLINAN